MNKLTQEQILTIKKLVEENRWDEIVLPSSFEDSVLQKAIPKKYKALVAPILDEDFDLALRRAAFIGKGCEDIIRDLLPLVKNINGISKRQHERTALHFIALHGLTELVHPLVMLDAYVNMLDSEDNTPAHLAAQNNHPETAGALMAEPGTLPTYNKAGETPLGTKIGQKTSEARMQLFAEYNRQTQKIRQSPPLPENLKYIFSLQPIFFCETSQSSDGELDNKGLISLLAPSKAIFDSIKAAAHDRIFTISDLKTIEAQYSYSLNKVISHCLKTMENSGNYFLLYLGPEEHNILLDIIEYSDRITDYFKADFRCVFEEPNNLLAHYCLESLEAIETEKLSLFSGSNIVTVSSNNKVRISKADLENTVSTIENRTHQSSCTLSSK